jgi:predicted transcriptional regulator
MSTTIRVSEETRDRLASLANATGRPMTRVLDDAVEALERKMFFDRFNRRYQELRDDPAAWSEIDQERRSEEGALRDRSE